MDTRRCLLSTLHQRSSLRGNGDLQGRFHQHFTSSFYSSRSQKLKKTDCLTLFSVLLGSVLLGSVHVKAARKMLVKLTPRRGFLRAREGPQPLEDEKETAEASTPTSIKSLRN